MDIDVGQGSNLCALLFILRYYTVINCYTYKDFIYVDDVKLVVTNIGDCLKL